MTNKMTVTCFTDLEGSTELTNTMGHADALPVIQEHLRIGKILCENIGGTYIKSLGDAHLIRFDDLEQGLEFALQMQEFYKAQHCFNRTPQLRVRIALFLGVVDITEDDIFGYGVNAAARVQGESSPTMVVVNKDLVDQIEKVWGVPKTKGFFEEIGERELKGLSKKHRLYSFKWEKFSSENSQFGISKQIHMHLEQASVEFSNLGFDEFAKLGKIIWPVVPREIVTAIHRAQAEIVKLLAMMGWNIQLLITDCGTQNQERKYSDRFRERLETYMKSIGITHMEVIYMSDLYDPQYANHTKVQSLFRTVSSKLTLNDLLAINNKGYSVVVKEEKETSPALDFLRPALSIAAVLYLSVREGHKVVILAGKDERIQWERAYRLPESRPKIGVLMIPVLKDNKEYQRQQKQNWPIWDSLPALKLDMEASNLAWWTFCLHAFIPAFPSPFVEIGKDESKPEISPNDWPEELEMTIPSSIDKDKLAVTVWNLLDPSR